jgi:hypothetical protein
MRLKSHIWVSAYLRRLDRRLVPGVVVRRGDADAGAIYIKLGSGPGEFQLFAPATSMAEGWGREGAMFVEDGRAWTAIYDTPRPEADVDRYLERQARSDPDLWVIELETRNGQHFLGETGAG